MCSYIRIRRPKPAEFVPRHGRKSSDIENPSSGLSEVIGGNPNRGCPQGSLLVAGFVYPASRICSLRTKLMENPQKPQQSILAVVLLIIIAGTFGYMIFGSSSLLGSTYDSIAPQQHTVSAQDNTPKLELLSYSCSSDYGYFTITGQVKNISSGSLKNVEAVGTAYASDGSYINSSDALIEYNPILAGQTSPFTVMMTMNPEMKKCNVDFKDLLGGSIAWQKASQ